MPREDSDRAARHEQSNQLKAELFNCVRPGVVDDKAKDIIQGLPITLVNALANYYVSAQREDDRFKKDNGEEPKELDLRRVIKGRLFEMIAQSEENIERNREGFGETTLQERELLRLLHSPSSFGLQDLWQGKNPDLAFVKMDENGITVEAVGEAKSVKKLDRRCASQLSSSGIEATLRRTVDWLNRNRSRLKTVGLTALSKTKGDFKIADDFVQVLVVPKDMDTTTTAAMVNPDSFADYPGEYEAFARLISEGERVVVRKSVFTTNELWEMTDRLEPLVAEKLNV